MYCHNWYVIDANEIRNMFLVLLNSSGLVSSSLIKTLH